jgi:hypothetical protein
MCNHWDGRAEPYLSLVDSLVSWVSNEFQGWKLLVVDGANALMRIAAQPANYHMNWNENGRRKCDPFMRWQYLMRYIKKRREFCCLNHLPWVGGLCLNLWVAM